MTKDCYSPAQQQMYNSMAAVESHQLVLRLAREVVEQAESLTPFESDFVCEVARLANRFKADLRLSPKQMGTLEELWCQHVLPTVAKGKIIIQ